MGFNLGGLNFFSIGKTNEKTRRHVKPVQRDIPRKINRLVNYLPWDFYTKKYLRIDDETFLEECIVIHKDGSLQMTYGFRGHDIESFSKDYIATVFEYFNTQIKMLGDGWMISVESQRFLMHDYPSASFDNIAGLLVDLERENEFKETGEHFDSSYYLNFVYKPENELKKKTSKLFFKGGANTDLVIKDEIKKFTEKVENITAVLSGRLIIRPLNCQETVTYLHSTCSMKRHGISLPDHFLFLDSYISDSSLEIGSTLKLGDYYIPIVEINDFPNRTRPAILNELNKLNLEYRWVSRFFPLTKDQALKDLMKIQQNGAAGRTSSKQLANDWMFGESQNKLENTASVAVQNDAEEAMYELGEGINGFGYYNSCVMVWDKDYSKAIAKMSKVTKCINELEFLCKEEEHGAFDAFRGMLAGNVTNDIRRPLISTGNYSHCLPFSSLWSGMEYNSFHNELCGVDKPLITCCTNFSTNYYLNLNVGDVGHTLILGPTGAGKSTFLNLIEASALKYPGIQVFILDYGLSALTLTLSVGGTYVNPADETVTFQPLRDIGEDPEEFAWAVNFIKSIVEMKGVKMNPRIETDIEDAMRGVAVMPIEMRTLTSFKLNSMYTDENGIKVVAEALKPYCIEGRFGKLFDGNSNSLKKKKWTMFEMESILGMGNDCSVPAILYIFHFLEKNFDGSLTYFIMDECWFGLEHPVIRENMKNYLYTLRKKNVFCIFATQNPATIARSPLATAIVQNCVSQIFLADPKAAQIKEEYKILGLTEDEISILSQTVPKKDYYYKSSLGTRLFQLGLGPIELALFRQAQSKFKMSNGNTIEWHEYLKYLLECRKKDGENASYVDKILDIQRVEFRHYLNGLNWEKQLNRG